MESDFLQVLTAIVGGENLLTGEAAMPHYTDWRGRFSGKALAVALPASTQQVAAVVKVCAAHQVAIVPQGGNTSLCGASVPLPQSRQLVLNLSRMDRIRAIDTINYTMTVEAGCKLASLYQVAEQANRLFPLGLTAIAPHCEIGGNLSTNAGGIGVLRYGSARDLVLGLEVVLPDGRIWDGLRSLRKDNTGYDLKQLFIGAEGTLGIITAAVLKLFPRPQATATACVGIGSPAAAVRLLAYMRSSCGQALSGFEIISRNCLDLVFQHIEDTQEPFGRKYPWYLLIKMDDVQQNVPDSVLRNALLSFGGEVQTFAIESDVREAERWWKLRKNISEAQKREGISVKHDVSVPVSRVAEFITLSSVALHERFAGIRIVAFGHMGDGNIHYNVSMLAASENPAFIEQHEAEVNRIVYDVVARLKGSISAEHGLGQLKRETICEYKDPLELELMRSIKQTLDPAGLMNPGKVI
ncbi:MAG: FAD-binding oxidoreductase [Gallionella sp.]|nr:FAD-binding oxidoreductase [Gallionella sp.]MDD4947663.1 FAD-binding oxidoreductase [Gallionella sp.]MDD5613132.1 FAD-binding oxidoreductase [Gallionella sp.]